MTAVDAEFRCRIEEAKYSVGFLFWWHYSRVRNALRAWRQEDA